MHFPWYISNAKADKYRSAYTPFGYDKGNDPNKLPVTDLDTAPIDRRIFEMRAKGYHTRKIACILNEENILSPSNCYYQTIGRSKPDGNGHLRSDYSVKYILRNPIYIGNLVHLKTTTVSHKNHKIIKHDESDCAVAEGNHEPIISLELLNKIRETNNSDSRGKHIKNGVTLQLSGLCCCADCRNKMKQTGETPAYICGRYARTGKQACGTHYRLLSCPIFALCLT